MIGEIGHAADHECAQVQGYDPWAEAALACGPVPLGVQAPNVAGKVRLSMRRRRMKRGRAAAMRRAPPRQYQELLCTRGQPHAIRVRSWRKFWRILGTSWTSTSHASARSRGDSRRWSCRSRMPWRTNTSKGMAATAIGRIVVRTSCNRRVVMRTSTLTSHVTRTSTPTSHMMVRTSTPTSHLMYMSTTTSHWRSHRRVSRKAGLRAFLGLSPRVVLSLGLETKAAQQGTQRSVPSCARRAQSSGRTGSRARMAHDMVAGLPPDHAPHKPFNAVMAGYLAPRRRLLFIVPGLAAVP